MFRKFFNKKFYQRRQFDTGSDSDVTEAFAYPSEGMLEAKEVSEGYASHPRNQGGSGGGSVSINETSEGSGLYRIETEGARE